MTSKNKMTRTTLLLLCGVFGCSNAVEPDLSNWSQIGDAAINIDNNSASNSGPREASNYIVSTDTYKDVRLSVEFLIDAATNSGIFVRCSDSESVSPETCYEINIWDEHENPDHRTGSIVLMAPPVAHVNTVGEWSTMQIEAVDDLIVVEVNGVETVRFRNDKFASGHVALQFGAGGSLQFRNVRLEAL